MQSDDGTVYILVKALNQDALAALCSVIKGYTPYLRKIGAMQKAFFLEQIKAKILPYTQPGAWEDGQTLFFNTLELEALREAITGFMQLLPRIAPPSKKRTATLQELGEFKTYFFSIPLPASGFTFRLQKNSGSEAN